MAEALTFNAADLVLREGAAPFRQVFTPGEIVGLAGLDGHGQDRFLRVMAGLDQAPGRVSLEMSGKSHPIAGFRDAERQRIVYVPRDRRSTGIFPDLSILDNFAIATPEADRRFGLISRKARLARYMHWKERLKIVAPSPDAPITALSGGNQQKVLLARALARNPRVLLLNDPTRGVDVATRHVLYDLFRELAAEGMALVILSSEIEEVLLLCNRLIVFRDHQVSAELSGEAMQSEAVIAAMFGRAA
ncbi:sugar ABC transporter ATP-binding protein [Xinfangfangia sp. D13-10-4-6]|uniref:ATP-binding cassette domain-containing protein n=1 Tax=Pseudogemmobacter hezensis TaxID=2737662 RepID=UPI001554F2FD|nr:ATP-binding cassette domain-containing protein [Pseudogemmobacter hezensis]NPD16799.1 sugar ABC transporter ATP-binding protein [Pseudogemmobacter hezensis]